MSEMAVGMSDKVAPAKERPSYLSQLDGSPDNWPEIARELTMLRGAVSGVEARHRELDEVIHNLKSRLRPVLDNTPKPGAVLREMVRPGADVPEVTSLVGSDVRLIWQEVTSLQDRAQDMIARVEDIIRDVTL